jgi:outer membrane protein TolC
MLTRTLLFLAASVLLATLSGGCMSSDAHRRKADRIATEIITEYQQKAMGRTEPFTIETPAQSLRRQLMITQHLPGHIGGKAVSNNLFKSSTPLKIKLIDAMQIAARNNRDYQSEKEKVFASALDLDLQREDYRNSYSSLLATTFTGSGSGDDANRSVKGEASSSISRKLESGLTLTSKLGIDLVKLLTLDETSTFGVFADATVSIPLLRGAGRSIAREPLTQAERNMIYTIWGFERFKKSFAIGVATSYLRTLELEKQIQNAEANYRSIVDTRKRMEAMGEAGRTTKTQVDQAMQNELTAKNSLISSRQRFQAQLDTLKVSIGIPVDARIELDAEELIRLSRSTMEKLGAEVGKSSSEIETLAAGYILSALEKRLDLKTTRHRLEDAQRQVRIAEDALDPGMRLQLSASTRDTRISGGTTTVNEDGTTSNPSDNNRSFSDNFNYSALLNLDLPWNKTKERAAYRKSLIAANAAERAIEKQEDTIKQELRGAARRIAELRETYLIQKLSVELAEKRVESTDIFVQAGRAPIRDLLDAQEDLVQARDRLVAAVVNYHLETLNLQRSLESLEVDEKGLWRKQ